MSAPLAPVSWEAYARALGIELQRRRLERGLTQEELAHAAGIARTHYQQLERGQWSPGSPANPSLKVFLGVSLVLGIAPCELLPPTNGLPVPIA